MMVTVSSPPHQMSSATAGEGPDVDPTAMDTLLKNLKKNMGELIVQGDDVSREMWHMYSVFEDLFGRSQMTAPLKQPADRASRAPRPAPRSPTTASQSAHLSPALQEIKTDQEMKSNLVKCQRTVETTENKLPSISQSEPEQATVPITSVSVIPDASSSPKTVLSRESPGLAQSSASSASNTTSNQLLDTIGVLANSNAESDDSDLDVVYQKLRYRPRQRKPEQIRVRTHRHQQIASSDPESIGYAGSNSIDSGYKSLCATPEVSDTLSAPEVRRSASDVSASDSSTTSGRPRSLDGQSSKIKMGTRSSACKMKGMDRVPRQHMNDVTLDHLMYLRQSLRKDRQDMVRSPNESLASSATCSPYRDSDLSPRTVTDDEWGLRPFRRATSSSSESTFVSRRGDEMDHEGGGEGSSEFLLSGVEYYDLETMQEFPSSSNYVTMMDDNSKYSSYQMAAAAKRVEQNERQIRSLYRKRGESSQSVDGDFPLRVPPPPYSSSGRTASRLVSRHQRQTDSKLTEAAIRVLEMIEDFRMEEALNRSGVHYAEDPQLVTGIPPIRRRKGPRPAPRPASTGSLMEQEFDIRSIAASADHHVYEEIMYDLVCERSGIPPPVPPERALARNRLLPVPPQRQPYGHPMDPRRIPQQRPVRTHNNPVYPMVPGSVAKTNMDRFLEIEWQMAQERRDGLPPDYPV